MVREGEVRKYRREITAEVVDKFAEISGDKNKIHLNPDYAKNLGYENSITHGLLVISFISGYLTEILGNGNVIISFETKFVRPILVGNLVDIELTILKIDTRFKKITLGFKVFSSNQITIKGKVDCISPVL